MSELSLLCNCVLCCLPAIWLHIHSRAAILRKNRTVLLEGWPSGLRRTPGKRVGVKAPRGFESPSLRHFTILKHAIAFHNPKRGLVYSYFALSMKLHCKPPYASTICRLACRLEWRAMKLTNAKLRSLPIGRKVSDGGGLYYQPTAPNKGKWSYRFAMDGKSHEMRLGTYPERSLKGREELRLNGLGLISCCLFTLKTL